jgi:hypothetical protein
MVVFFHFSVIGAKRRGGPAGSGACRSERADQPARQPIAGQLIKPQLTPVSVVDAGCPGRDSRHRRPMCDQPYSHAHPPAPNVKAPARSGRSASHVKCADLVSRTFDELQGFEGGPEAVSAVP